MHSNKQASDRDDKVMVRILFFKIQSLSCTFFQINTSLNFNFMTYEVG